MTTTCFSVEMDEMARVSAVGRTMPWHMQSR
jgi:hypothetical protein